MEQVEFIAHKSLHGRPVEIEHLQMHFESDGLLWRIADLCKARGNAPDSITIKSPEHLEGRYVNTTGTWKKEVRNV